jgi:hypothetical protein
MGAATFGVHVGLPDNSVLLTSAHEFETLFWLLYNHLVESFHVYAILFILMYN